MANKTKPLTVRLDADKLAKIKDRTGMQSNQRVMDYLLDRYWQDTQNKDVIQSVIQNVIQTPQDAKTVVIQSQPASPKHHVTIAAIEIMSAYAQRRRDEVTDGVQFAAWKADLTADTRLTDKQKRDTIAMGLGGLSG